MTGQQWFDGANTESKKLDLKPEDMDTCSYNSVLQIVFSFNISFSFD